MKYDFTSIIERKGKDAIAVDLIGKEASFTSAPTAPKDGFSAIPMWVADMNFAVVPTIQDAIIERVKHPTFGYFATRDEYYDSIIQWQSTRNHVEGLTKEAIGYENGVLGCVCSALQAFSAPGEKVLVHSPTYIGFTHSFEDTGREAVLSPLKKDENGIYRMDYEDMDKKLKEHHIHLAIFCSPHNPCGRVWEKWEIEKAMEVYKNNDCVVISDEIWSDILLNGNTHIPTQSVSEDAKQRTIAIYAPSKTFNLAGLIGSYHIIYNPYLRDRVRRMAHTSHYNEMNVLSMYALIGAYKEEGYVWCDELKEVLSNNINYAYDVLKDMDGISVTKPEGTYMMFVNIEEYCKKHNVDVDTILHRGWDVGVGWQDGRPFHDPYAIRINFAVPTSLTMEAMDRIQKYVFND